MAAMDLDINSIAYDAPLTVRDPGTLWRQKQNSKGANGKTVTIPDADLRGKNVLISGSNNGIGREAAIQFAKWGANVYLACRDPPKHETHPEAVVKECLAGARAARHEKSVVEWWEVDYTSLSTVSALAQRWLDSGKPLDILANNAGMGASPGGGNVFKTKDGFEIIHQVNFLAHVLLTLKLLPALAKASTPRIVCTTSCFHYVGRFDLGNCNGEKGRAGTEGVNYYQNNKLWFQTWLTELQRRLLQNEEYRHITVNGCHPGYVNSGIWELPRASDSLLAYVRALVVKALAYFLAVNEQQGSLAILNTATAIEAGPDPKVQGVGVIGGKGGGRYFNRIWEETPMPHTKDADCRCRVWRKVNEELGLEKQGLLDVLGVKYVESKL